MKKTNNKGFSLVELIIVIAIMVILVAVIAPQYTKFVQKSRISADVNTAADIATAIDVAIAAGESPFNSAGTSVDFSKVDNMTGWPLSKQAGNNSSWTISGDNEDGVASIGLDATKAVDSSKVKQADLYPSTATD